MAIFKKNNKKLRFFTIKGLIIGKKSVVIRKIFAKDFLTFFSII